WSRPSRRRTRRSRTDGPGGRLRVPVFARENDFRVLRAVRERSYAGFPEEIAAYDRSRRSGAGSSAVPGREYSPPRALCQGARASSWQSEAPVLVCEPLGFRESPRRKGSPWEWQTKQRTPLKTSPARPKRPLVKRRRTRISKAKESLIRLRPR